MQQLAQVEMPADFNGHSYAVCEQGRTAQLLVKTTMNRTHVL